MYPEYYRKSSDHVKGSNEMTPDPFKIARILYITSKNTGDDLSFNIFIIPFIQFCLLVEPYKNMDREAGLLIVSQ